MRFFFRILHWIRACAQAVQNGIDQWLPGDVRRVDPVVRRDPAEPQRQLGDTGHQEVTGYVVRKVNQGEVLPGDVSSQQRIGNQVRISRTSGRVQGPSGAVGGGDAVNLRCGSCGGYDIVNVHTPCSHCGHLICSVCANRLVMPSRGTLVLCPAAYSSYCSSWDCWEETDAAKGGVSGWKNPPSKISVDCPCCNLP